MSYFTELHAGLCNAWTGVVLFNLIGIAAMLKNRRVGQRLTDMSWYTFSDRVSSYSSMGMMLAIVVLSIWVPLKIQTAWFDVGAVIYAAGVAGYIAAMHNYSTTPLDQPVVKGLYRISRNPLYFFSSLAILGMCVASASFPLLVLWALYNIPTHFIVLGEERYCLETYGNGFDDFMDRVPRYFLFF